MFTAASIVLQMGNFTKQSLIVVAKLQRWDGLTQCDQPPPTALTASVRGGTGRHPRPPDGVSVVRAPRPRRLPLRLSVARWLPSPTRPQPSLSFPFIRNARALPFVPHQRFRFVILIRLTERRGRWTDARALHSATCLHLSCASTHVRSPDCNLINLSTPRPHNTTNIHE